MLPKASPEESLGTAHFLFVCVSSALLLKGWQSMNENFLDQMERRNEEAGFVVFSQ